MASSTSTSRAGRTRYREIERYLRALVDAARPGDPLPSEAELCERFSVSRMTVRQALAELTNDGLVERRRGQGTFVAHRPVHRRPGVFLSFTEEMGRRGMQATSRLLGAGMDEPRRAEVLELGLAPGQQVVRITRVRLADGVPVALEEAALVPELGHVLEEDLGGGSLHGALAERGVIATRATGTITARLARASETELLDLAPQSALLVELRVLFDQEGRVFERTETRYAADRYVIDVVHTHP
jgi:GntR family transcriptional regulator